MNLPTEYNRIVFVVEKAAKKALCKYCEKNGMYLSAVMTKILTEFLKKEGLVK